jgi:hypothetical protein
MSDYQKDVCGTIFKPVHGTRQVGPGDVIINNNGVTRPGWFNGTHVQG